MSTRSRSWCFTINNPKKRDINEFYFLDAKYKIFGFEEGKEETLHMQGYVYLNEASTLSVMKKKLSRAHLEVAKGTPQQAATYCKKENDYTEIGELPVQGRLNYSDIEKVMQDPESNFTLYNQYRKAYREYNNMKKKTNDEQKELYLIPEVDIYKYASKYPKEDVFMDEDIDTYDNEGVMFVTNNRYDTSFPIVKWSAGYPMRIKRGYEIVIINPRIVYIVYSSVVEYNNLIQKYIDYFDKVWESTD